MPNAIVYDDIAHIIKAGEEDTTCCGKTIKKGEADKYISMGTLYMDDFMADLFSREELEVCQECEDNVDYT